MRGVPCGGPYRLETRFRSAERQPLHSIVRGDMRHLIGVGDIWVLAGQSNAVGYGRSPVHDPPEVGLHALRYDGGWGLATHPLSDSTATLYPSMTERANPGHSPHLSFGRRLRRSLGYPIGLLPAALGGSRLAYWSRGDEHGYGLFRDLLARVRVAGGRVAGLVWYQGESDATPERAADYARRLTEFLQAVRRGLEQHDLPILLVQLNRKRRDAGKFTDEGWSMIREAQRRVAAALPKAGIVPSLDLSLDEMGHNGSAGNVALGERLAACALATAYGWDVEHRAPEIATARVSGDGSAVELRFDHVSGRLDSVEPSAPCYRVLDAAGVVPVERTEYVGSNTAVLRLGRALDGPATVSGAYGINPPIVPVDVDRAMPILAFHEVPVTGAPG